MSNLTDVMEPITAAILQAAPETATSVVCAISSAVSAKRQADALERIAAVLDGNRGYGLNDLVEQVIVAGRNGR